MWDVTQKQHIWIKKYTLYHNIEYNYKMVYAVGDGSYGQSDIFNTFFSFQSKPRQPCNRHNANPKIAVSIFRWREIVPADSCEPTLFFFFKNNFSIMHCLKIKNICISIITLFLKVRLKGTFMAIWKCIIINVLPSIKLSDIFFFCNASEVSRSIVWFKIIKS